MVNILELYESDTAIGREISKLSKKARTYSSWLNFYRGRLLEYAIKRFSYDTNEEIPEKEIEMRLLILGKCGINPIKDMLTACDVTLNGITRYYDEWTHYNYVTPIESGSCEIDKDGILIDNNSLRTPTMPLINRYAMTLAHIEVTLISALVNYRSHVNYIAKTNSQRESIRAFRQALYEGSDASISDEEMLGIQVENLSNSQRLSLLDIYELKRDVFNDYLKAIGIPIVNVKRERMITDEVQFENIMPKLDIKDAFECRKKAIEKVNKLFGTEYSVKCNVPYDDSNITKEVIPEQKDNEVVDNG